MSKEESSEQGPQEAGGGEGGKKDPNSDLYESRASKKVIRLITVMAYMFSVSFVAIVLSAYYIFLWEPPNPRLMKRPVHLAAEPEIQFLLSDPPVVLNESAVLSRNYLIEVAEERKNSKEASRTSLSSRILGEGRDDEAARNREKLDESLFLLRNSLMNFLRNRANDSKDDSSGNSSASIQSSSKDGGKSVSKARSETDPKKHEDFFWKLKNPKIHDNATSLTPDSAIISKDEAKRDRSSNDRNRNRGRNVLRDDDHRDFDSMENTIIDRENIPANFHAAVGELNAKMKMNRVGNSQVFTNTARTTKITNESEIIMTTRDPETKQQRGDHANEPGLHANDRSIVDYARYLEFLRPSNLSSATLASVAMKLRETQIEEMAVKSMTTASETQQPEITTERQNDLSIISTESTEIFSSSPVLMSENVQSNSSAETDISTEKRPEST